MNPVAEISRPVSRFVWYELMTTDAQAAAEFYAGVVGWQAQDAGMPHMHYTLLSVGSTMVGGLMDLPAEACAGGAQPAWMGYLSVPDVDAALTRLVAAGGEVHRPADDIPGVGRFAVVADPQGAAFYLFAPEPGEQPPQAAAGTPGLIGWHELHATDLDAAWAFYAEQFGWTLDEAIDMGPLGSYQLFATGEGPAVGGMMRKLPEEPVPAWLYYFNVAEIHSAVERVRTLGGQVLAEPHQVPGGSWIAQCQDPQGAMFAVVGPQA